MAIWQADYSIMPRKTHGFSSPKGASDTVADPKGENPWADSTFPVSELSHILLLAESWSPSVKLWGQESSNSIEVVYDGAKIEEVIVRFDLRQPSKQFIKDIVSLASRHDYLLMNQQGATVEPILDNLLDDLLQSEAIRYVTDPATFLDNLGGRRQS